MFEIPNFEKFIDFFRLKSKTQKSSKMPFSIEVKFPHLNFLFTMEEFKTELGKKILIFENLAIFYVKFKNSKIIKCSFLLVFKFTPLM